MTSLQTRAIKELVKLARTDRDLSIALEALSVLGVPKKEVEKVMGWYH